LDLNEYMIEAMQVGIIETVKDDEQDDAVDSAAAESSA
jgi:hypothetical protein